MDEKFTPRKTNRWIATAAYEISRIQLRWGLTSDRKFSATLHINARTIAKLHPDHPDPTLRLETIDRIYSILIALLRSHFDEESREAEYRFLIESRIRIMQSVAPLPAAVQEIELDELKHSF